MLGNSYWIGLNVPILAHTEAAEDVDDKAGDILDATNIQNKDHAEGTLLQGPTETFEDERTVELRDFRIKARRLGSAHSPGDIVAWLPAQSLIIFIDTAFHERLLPIFDDTDTAAWLGTWDNEFEPLKATYVILDHEHPTNMAQVRRYTKDYPVYLCGKIANHLENGETLDDAYYVNQYPY